MYQHSYCFSCGKETFPQAQICSNCYQLEKAEETEIVGVQIKCKNCTFLNAYDAIQCSVCELIFQQNLVPDKIPISKSLITCKKCNFQNHMSNQVCLNCQNDLFQAIKKKCDICSFSVKQSIYQKHHKQCMLSKDLIQRQEKAIKIQKVPFLPPYKSIRSGPLIKKPLLLPKKEVKSTTTQCVHCHTVFENKQYAEHQPKCPAKNQLMMKLSDPFTRMTPLQTEAMKHMHNKAAKEHNSVKLELQNRIKKLGYTNQDLDNLQFYIQNYAPIIIQIHVSKHMQFFIKDTHYRSQFQTNKSSGSLSRTSRTSWEDRMFDKNYAKATDYERVKYGVINFTNDPKGVSCASGYGPSYFLLKSHVRERCTFTDKDSSSADAAIATFKYSFKILSKLNDNQLKAAFDASKAKQVASNCSATYKQMQVHGPIEFSKDIQRIYVNKNQIKASKQLLDMVYEFSKKNNVDHDFI